ncbi:ATP-binding protein [Sphingomonas sp. RB3P16]|uniref:ATP-binding protein n=1 Tax=Parasphingomonas frigoris TaxID=3096163 RepID=UPI002FCCAE5D
MEETDRDAVRAIDPAAKAPRASSLDLLPQSQAAFLQMAELTSDLIGLCDADGRLLYLNPAGRQLIGVADADIFPMRLSDYVVPEQRALVAATIIPTARRDGMWAGPMQIVNRTTNRIVDVARSTFVTRDESGSVVGFVSVMRDVTQASEAQERLRRQGEMFEALIANNPFGVYLVDADFTLRVISRGARRVFENIADPIGRNFEDVLRALWTEPFVSEAIGHFRDTLHSGRPYESRPTVQQRSDIEAREAYDWRIERITLPDDRHGVVCYFYDLTERDEWSRKLAHREAQLRDLAVDLERRVRARTASLNQANERLTAEIERREALQAAQLQSQKLEAVGQLTSGIAHDFNNILGAAIGAFIVIQNRSADPRVQQVAQMGNRAIERGAALVRQLLAFARQQDVVPQSVDLAAAIREISDLIAHGVRGNVELTVTCAPNVWPALADPAQLQSALLNLASNASDAMNGTGHLRITVTRSPASAPEHPVELAGRDAVLVLVADDGPGMDSRTLQRITEPFFTTKARGKGTGLGLAMVQRFVQQSLGALRIESRVGQGTTFSIYLPRANDVADGAAGGPASAEDAMVGPGRSHETVLIVDADSDLCAVLAEGLSDDGFEVIVATDPAGARDALRTRAIDAVVADVDMVAPDNRAAVLWLRAERPDLACLFTSANGTAATLESEAVLPKPFTPALLRTALRSLLVARDRRATDAERLDRLARRLQSECTRSLLAHWRAIRSKDDVPPFATFAIDACSEPHRIVVLDVDLGRVPIDFTVTAVGDALSAAAPGGATGASELAISGSDDLAAQEAAYRRCALTGKPSYEYARIDLGDGSPETFERLLLPFSSDGSAVDRIVGAVVFDQSPLESPS